MKKQQAWATKELNLADLGDERLKERLIQLAGAFFKSPESPINQAFGSWADVKAAYRFFSNAKIEDKKIMDSHSQATKTRCKTEDTVLAIQDTSYFNYTSHPQTVGLGPLNSHRGLNVKKLVASGLIMHTSFAVSKEGLPLGILEQKISSREDISAEIKELKRKTHNTVFPIEERESNKWLASLKSTQQLFRGERTKLITICDREADIYEFFKLASELDAKLIVRARHDRRVNKSSPFSRTTGEALWKLLKSEKVVAELEVQIPKAEKQVARKATCEVRFREVVISPTAYNMKNQTDLLPLLGLKAIYVAEKNPPAEVAEPLDWMLLTNLEVNTTEDTLDIIKKYSLRWRIEVFHKILKSGLKVEDCRLSTAERLSRYLSLMSIVAWRIFWLTLIERNIPDVSCLFLFSDVEWKILFVNFNPKSKIPNKPPSIRQCIRWIAQLGGFLARKGDKEPGITHIWRGLKKLANLIEGFELKNKIK